MERLKLALKHPLTKAIDQDDRWSKLSDFREHLQVTSKMTDLESSLAVTMNHPIAFAAAQDALATEGEAHSGRGAIARLVLSTNIFNTLLRRDM